jgi:iron complex outermembrane receptor protein
MSNNFQRSAIALFVTTAITAAPTFAAEDDKTKKIKKDVEKISVIGSRAAPRSAADSAVPVDIIDGAEIAGQGPSDMVSLLQNIVPSFNVNDQPINDASTLVRPANLRGLASDHTLVLVNGKRRHRSAVITFLGGGLSDGAQGPDLSVIPSAGIKQVDVLRDGAAAQYGSDALAGVMNFTLKNASEGGMFEVKYGEFYEGDGDGVQISGNLGLPLTEDGFFNTSFELKQSDPTSRSVQRDDAQALINAGNTAVESPAQIWGSPEVKEDFKVFINAGIDLGNDAEAYAFGNIAKRDVEGGFYYRNPHTRGGVNKGAGMPSGTFDDKGIEIITPTLLVGDLTPNDGISCPIIPITTGNVLTQQNYIDGVQNNPNCFAFNEIRPGGFTPKFGGKVIDSSLVLGTKGEMGDEIFYDVSLSHGRNEVNYKITNSLNPSLGPDTPFDFSPGSYIQQEDMLNLDLSKTVDVGYDEPMNIAGGFEYRNESYQSIAGDQESWEIGPLASQGFGIGSNGFPGLSARSAGKTSRNSVALYLDTETYFTDNLMVGAAIRFEDFSDFGNTTKGKLSARWEFVEDWAVRGALSTGFKAPTIGQTTVRNVTTAFGTDGALIDRATLPPTDPIAVKKGATLLTPEESQSYSLGLVGEFDNGIFLTIDYFNIEVTDRISTTSGIKLTDQDRADLIAAGVTDASSFTEVSYFTNDFDTATQGIDIVASYDMDMFDGETKLSFAYNWTQTIVDRASDNISSERVKMLENNLPALRYNLTANHTNGDWRVLGRVRYAGAIYEDHLDSGLPFNVGSEVVFDAELAYTVDDNWKLTAGATNLFDETPDEITPYDTEIAGSLYPTTSPIGINGGYYYMKATYTF